MTKGGLEKTAGLEGRSGFESMAGAGPAVPAIDLPPDLSASIVSWRVLENPSPVESEKRVRHKRARALGDRLRRCCARRVG